MTTEAAKEDPLARAVAQVSLANVALFFSMCDAVLYTGKCTPQKIAEFVRVNYGGLGDQQRSEAGNAMIAFIVSKLEGAEGDDHAPV